MEEDKLAPDVDAFFWGKRHYNYVRRFTQIKPLSHGAEGFSFLVQEVDEDVQPVRKLVIKYARAMGWEPNTQNEKDLMEQMRHAPHVVSPVDIGTSRLQRVLLVMEYLENGTLNRFMHRVKRRKCRIPNMVLWRIFLCLTRAVVAMAYPPEEPVERETILDDTEPVSLVHGDLHLANVLFGALDLDDSEHDIVPIVKLIDFGFATEVGSYGRDDEPGIARNIFDIGQVMGRLLRAFAGDQWNMLSWYDDEDLDGVLKELIRGCVHPVLANRPKLQQLLTICETAVANRSAADYAENEDEGFSERPDSLKHWLKAMLLDADDEREFATASDEILWAPLDIPRPERSYASDYY